MKPPWYRNRPASRDDDTVTEWLMEHVGLPMMLPAAAMATGVWRGLGWLKRHVGGAR